MLGPISNDRRCERRCGIVCGPGTMLKRQMPARLSRGAETHPDGADHTIRSPDLVIASARSKHRRIRMSAGSMENTVALESV